MNQKDIHKLKTIYTTILESKKGSGPPYVKVYSNGSKFYYKDRKMTMFHRTDGPAVEWSDGTKEWWLNGMLHREDGPAFECASGHKEWYLKGNYLTEQEFKAYLANKQYKASHDTTTDFEAFD